MRQVLHGFVNASLQPLGIRAVSTRWGPRGFSASLLRLREQGFRPTMIVDVGAASGQWTRECLAIFPNAHYLLVEPLPENAPALRSLAADHPNVRSWQGGLGPQDGSLQFHAQGDQSSFLAPSANVSAVAHSTITVPVRTMDSFLGTPDMPTPPSLIKEDVQGFELEVLRGATRCLQSADFVLLEVSFRRLYQGTPLAHDVVAFMGERGYRIYDICSYIQRPLDSELVQSDLFFAKDGSMAFAREDYA